mgnify:CR=1 FL=1
MNTGYLGTVMKPDVIVIGGGPAGGGGHRIQRRDVAVRHGHHVRPPVVSKLDSLHRGLGIPGKADAHQYIPGTDPQDALQDIPGAVARGIWVQ